MKLVSLNVAFFERNNDKLVDFLKTQKADILCLQEVIKKIDDGVDLDFISKDAIDEVSSDLKQSFLPRFGFYRSSKRLISMVRNILCLILAEKLNLGIILNPRMKFLKVKIYLSKTILRMLLIGQNGLKKITVQFRWLI